MFNSMIVSILMLEALRASAHVAGAAAIPGSVRGAQPQRGACLHPARVANSLSKICSKGWVAQKPLLDR